LHSTASSTLQRAGKWLLNSGIQNENGGVARYYRSDVAANLPASTEITGYALAGYCYLFEQTAEEEYLAAAQRTAQFLTDIAWDRQSGTMPFEIDAGRRFSYFFDCGIIARALLSLHRLQPAEHLIAVARGIAISMQQDFRALAGYHPIVMLPCKSPVAHEIWWSRMPGAFHLKAGLAWLELSEITGESAFADSYEELLAFSLSCYPETLENEQDRFKQMDRLHAWSYFLEGLQPVKHRATVAPVLSAALRRGESLLEELAPAFVRSDACAQLLRIRLLDGAQATAMDIERLESFQYDGTDLRLQGGFAFGRRDGVLTPHVNPVSTVFCMQALEMAKTGSLDSFDWRKLY
jgi:hypothetical protein